MMTGRSTRSKRQLPKQHQEVHLRAKWTTSLTKILVDLMVDQVQKGNKRKKTFGKKAWKYISDEFCKKTGLKWERDQLKNRYSALRKQYFTVKSLLDQRDFKWDEPTGVILAADEAWDRYIKEHPDVESVRATGCPLYKHLCTIFFQPDSNGAHKGLPEEEQELEEDEEERTPSPNVLCPRPLNMFNGYFSSDSDEEEEEEEDEADIAEEEEDKPHRVVTPPSRKRGRLGIDESLANAILEMANASRMRTEAVRKCNEKFSIADCVRALDEMEGIDEGVYFSALDLFHNRNAREIFLSLKIEKRSTWLYGKFSVPLQG